MGVVFNKEIMKKCTVCGEDKPLSEYFRKRDSHEGFCKVCKENKRKERFKNNPQLAKDRQRKALQKIHSSPENILAAKIKSAYYYQKNKIKHAEWSTAWIKTRPEKRLEYQRRWRAKNLDVVRYHANKRRTTKLNAIPKWVDKEWEEFAIKELYALAVLREKLTGIVWHVDHIVPLQSDKVCGLHCVANLQLLTKSANISKGNRTWPDMWVD